MPKLKRNTRQSKKSRDSARKRALRSHQQLSAVEDQHSTDDHQESAQGNNQLQEPAQGNNQLQEPAQGNNHLQEPAQGNNQLQEPAQEESAQGNNQEAGQGNNQEAAQGNNQEPAQGESAQGINHEAAQGNNPLTQQEDAIISCPYEFSTRDHFVTNITVSCLFFGIRVSLLCPYIYTSYITSYPVLITYNSFACYYATTTDNLTKAFQL